MMTNEKQINYNAKNFSIAHQFLYNCNGVVQFQLKCKCHENKNKRWILII